MNDSDIKFTINSGNYEGDTYGFTLASDKGEKAWTVTRLRTPPPSRIKYKIEMAITAREGNIKASGAIEQEKINKILEKLTHVADELEVTLQGLDGEEYLITIDANGIKEGNVMHEKERKPEFVVNVLAWGLHA